MDDPGISLEEGGLSFIGILGSRKPLAFKVKINAARRCNADVSVPSGRFTPF